MKKEKVLTKKIINIFLCLSIIMSYIPTPVFAVDDKQVEVNGNTITLSDTDSDSYYEIKNAEELYAFATLVNGGEKNINAELTANIVVNSEEEMESDNPREWIPIGNSSSNFYSGNFEGHNYTISGLYQNDSGSTYGGLIGYLVSGTVTNVSIVNSNIYAGTYIGAIVGTNVGTVRGCFSSGIIKGAGTVGGIAGQNYGAISKCYSTASIISLLAANHPYRFSGFGGIVGRNFENRGGTISDCYYVPEISGDDYTKTIIGGDNGTPDGASNCYYFVEGNTENDDYSGTLVKTKKQFLSGEVAYLLNSGVVDGTQTFYQDINGTNYPSFSGATVYYGYVCDEAISDKVYTNNVTANATQKPEHSWLEATCASPKTCVYCENTEGNAKGHNLVYSPTDNVIKEVCANNCGHSETAKLDINKDVSKVYTGSGIKALKIEYSKNWSGEKIADEEIIYTNNENVGTATGSIELNDITVTMEFEIIAKSLKDDNIEVTLVPTSETYSGENFTPTINVVYDTKILERDTDYTIEWDKNEIMEADTYTVTISGKENYKESVEKEFKVNVAKLTDVEVKQEGNLTYDGGEQVASVSTNAIAVNNQPITFTYSSSENGNYGTDIPKFTDAGSYEVWYKVEAPNHEEYKGKFEVKINKQIVEVPTIQSKSYNAEIQTADITDTNIYEVTKNNGGTNKGTYEIVLKLKNTKNYEWKTTQNDSITLDFEITQVENEWEINPTINNWIYGSTASTPLYKAKFGNVKVNYTGTANDNSLWDSESAPYKTGNYIMTVTVTETDNYTKLSKEVPFTINKASYDLTNAKWNYSEEFKYDGKTKNVSVEGLPNGVMVKEYKGNTGLKVGNYTASVELEYDSDNYNKPSINDLEWRIGNNWTPTEYTTTQANGNGWLNKDFEITAQNGYMISLTNTVDGEWKNKLIGSVEGEDSSITFYLKNETTGEISLAKTENYKLDKNTDNTNSIGKVKFDELNNWEKFLNAITFDLLYNKEIKVKVDASDKLSGIDKIEYVESDKELTLKEVQALTNWNKLSEDGKVVSVEDSKQFVYYLRIADKAGNITYISSDGAEYDTSAPSITGIENNKTYYSTQKVTITDKNIESIKLNGEDKTDTIILEGNKKTTYTIVAIDKAGNESTVTIKMAKLNDITDVTTDNVTPKDKTELEGAKTELEKDLEENADIYSEEEKNAIKDKIKDIEENLVIIENVEAVEDLINNLPNTINKGDKEKVEEAKKSYDKLSDYEKNLLAPEIKDKLDKAIKSLEEVNNPKTGDNISLFMFMFVISIVGIIFTTKLEKNYEK